MTFENIVWVVVGLGGFWLAFKLLVARPLAKLGKASPEETIQIVVDEEPASSSHVLSIPLREYPELRGLSPEGREELKRVINLTWQEATFAAAGTFTLLQYRRIQSRNDIGGQIALLRNGIYNLKDSLKVIFSQEP